MFGLTFEYKKFDARCNTPNKLINTIFFMSPALGKKYFCSYIKLS